jgi:CDP-glucose 4,6-dehydratase
MESLVIDPAFWSGKRVFLTGHTGFKGAWMSLLLARLGASTFGYSLPPKDKCDLFVIADVERRVQHFVGDVRDLRTLKTAIQATNPDVVIHMAAQALVRPSYDDPIGTYSTNVMGTANVLEAARGMPGLRSVVVVTTDKCYEDNVPSGGYSETDRLGGFDPYSNSKACAELVTSAYRDSFYHTPDSPRIGSARAGNVIGGGDWAQDRLVPDAVRAFLTGDTLRLRNPAAVRPWQHVLDPLCAYLLLAEKLYLCTEGADSGWNFGPNAESEVSVEDMVDRLSRRWGAKTHWVAEIGPQIHESSRLVLNCSRAKSQLRWTPLLDLNTAVQLTVDWYWSFSKKQNMADLTVAQIEAVLEKCSVATDERRPMTRDRG